MFARLTLLTGMSQAAGCVMSISGRRQNYPFPSVLSPNHQFSHHFPHSRCHRVPSGSTRSGQILFWRRSQTVDFCVAPRRPTNSFKTPIGVDSHSTKIRRREMSKVVQSAIEVQRLRHIGDGVNVDIGVCERTSSLASWQFSTHALHL